MKIAGLQDYWYTPFLNETSLSIRPKTSFASPIAPAEQMGSSIEDLAKQIIELKEGLLDFFGASRVTNVKGIRSILEQAFASSTSPLGLDAQGTPTTLSSTEEINTIPTSFSPFGPTWDTFSTSQATISGTYVGSDDVLMFKVTKEGEIGVDDAQIKVYNGQGQEIDKIDVKKEFPEGTPFHLDNGLAVQFSAGTLEKNEIFYVDVLSDGSFDPATPSFETLSTASPIIGGVYSGSSDDRYTFEAKDHGDVGDDDIDFDVFDMYGTKIADFKYKKEDAGQAIPVINGITFRLDSGYIEDKTTFGVNVYTSIPSSVDPTNPFNGIGNDNPNFEPGFSVTNGSFDLNGFIIDVFETDSILSVLSRINASGAGVTATFDAATERILFVHDTPGSSGQIVLSNDTSGFLDATKLSGTNQVTGTDSDLIRPLSEVPKLAGIGNGTFSISGVSFMVDTSTDSLSGLLNQINASAAGVTAVFDENLNMVLIHSSDPGASFSLHNESSNFFAGVLIPEDTYKGQFKINGSKEKPGFVDTVRFRRQLQEFGKSLKNLYQTDFDPMANKTAQVAKTQLRQAIVNTFERITDLTHSDTFRSGMGITFDFTDPVKGVLQVDPEKLSRTLNNKFGDLEDFLLAEWDVHGTSGLLPAMEKAIDEIAESLIPNLDPQSSLGLIVDLKA